MDSQDQSAPATVDEAQISTLISGRIQRAREDYTSYQQAIMHIGNPILGEPDNMQATLAVTEILSRIQLMRHKVLLGAVQGFGLHPEKLAALDRVVNRTTNSIFSDESGTSTSQRRLLNQLFDQT